MTINFYKDNTKIDINKTGTGETDYLGMEKIESIVRLHADVFCKIQRDLQNLQKLLPKTEFGKTSISHDWFWDEPIEAAYWTRKKHGEHCSGMSGSPFKVLGIRITPTSFSLITEPDISFPFGFSTKERVLKDIPFDGIEFNTLLENANQKDDAKKVDPVQLVVETQCNNNALNVAIYNKYDQVVGAVEVENMDGQIQVLVWDTASVVDGDMPSEIVKPVIDFKSIPGECHNDLSTNPVF